MKLEALEFTIEHGFKIKQSFSFAKNNSRSVLEKMKGKHTGVYIFYNDKHEPIYVGRSENVRNRLCSHLLYGSKNSQKFMDQVKGISVIIMAYCYDLRELEGNLIYLYKPVFNIHKNKLSFYRFFEKKYKRKCTAISKSRNEQCNNTALQNGYCRIHGGQGKKWDVLVDEEMKEMGF